jgi:hypothetical protein
LPKTGAVRAEDSKSTKEGQEENGIWNALVKNYELVEGAQLSNSFILLLVLNETNQALTTTQISQLISRRSKGQIYKVSGTLRDSLEHRKREGYVSGIDQGNKTLYSITTKGQKLLKGWIGFLSAY